MTVPGRKLDVELVETDDDDGFDELGPTAPLGEPGAGVEARPRWTWRRIARAWPVAVVALLVAVAYGITGARDRAEHERLREALIGQSGYLEDLSGPLRLVWSSDALGEFLYPSVTIEDTTIVHGMRQETEFVAALDAATGEQRWIVEGEPDSSRYCESPLLEEYEAGPATVCLFSSYSSEGNEWPQAVEHRDVATGELIASSQERSARASTVWGAGLVELVSADGATELRSVDLEGRVTWATQLLDHELAPEDDTHLYAAGDVAVAAVLSRGIVIDATGHVVLDHDFATESQGVENEMGGYVVQYFGSVQPLPGGGYAASGGSTPRTISLYDDDGTFLLDWDATLLHLGLDDGSLGKVALLSETDEIVLIDLDTGEEVFRIEDRGSGQGLVLDGAVVLSGQSALRSIDGTTGEERWSLATSGHILGSDGQAVLLSEEDGLVTRVRAIDLGSGRELWNQAFDLSESWLLPVDGVLYLMGDGVGLSRYGR